MKTPAYILPSLNGLPPHLTPDLVSTVAGNRAFNVGVGEIAPIAPAVKAYGSFCAGDRQHTKDTSSSSAISPTKMSIEEATAIARKPFHAMTQQTDHVLMLSTRTSVASPSTPASAKALTVYNYRGIMTMSIPEFVEYATSLRPDIIQLPNEDSTPSTSKSRLGKLQSRNIAWMDECLVSLGILNLTEMNDSANKAKASRNVDVKAIEREQKKKKKRKGWVEDDDHEGKDDPLVDPGTYKPILFAAVDGGLDSSSRGKSAQALKDKPIDGTFPRAIYLLIV